jgi:hypothetical protein
MDRYRPPSRSRRVNAFGAERVLDAEEDLERAGRAGDDQLAARDIVRWQRVQTRVFTVLPFCWIVAFWRFGR